MQVRWNRRIFGPHKPISLTQRAAFCVMAACGKGSRSYAEEGMCEPEWLFNQLHVKLSRDDDDAIFDHCCHWLLPVVEG